MGEKLLSCVLLADRHHGVTEGMCGLLKTAFGTVVMVDDRCRCSRARAGSDPMWRSWTSLWLRTAAWAGCVSCGSAVPSLKVIVLSVHDEQSVRRAAMDAGADAFVLKRAIATDLLPTVELVRGRVGAAK